MTVGEQRPTMDEQPPRQDQGGRKRVALALQGGGAHGAFTWGVLDRLLEEERLEIEAISATSVGAMSGAALVQGHVKNGRQGARDALDAIWRKVAEAAAFSPLQRSLYDRMLGNWNLDQSPAFFWTDLMARAFSPYEINPQNINPLHSFLHANIDAATIRAADIKLFVAATSARTGESHVFDQTEITPDVILASTCLPLVIQAVPIDGEPYWDGGYLGNPPLQPLLEHCTSSDIVIVQVNPFEREKRLRSAAEIFNRLNEITMNASLRHELRLIAFIQEMIEGGKLADEGSGLVRRTRIHTIDSGKTLVELGVASKMNGEREFLEFLKSAGRDAADSWLAASFDSVGERSTVDLAAKVPAGPPGTAERPAKAPRATR
jgi:NTE family protein